MDLPGSRITDRDTLPDRIAARRLVGPQYRCQCTRLPREGKQVISLQQYFDLTTKHQYGILGLD
jgi:hypothetical protein